MVPMSELKPLEECQSCQFFKKENLFEAGICRRHPPKIFVDQVTGAIESKSPPVMQYWWCGEYQRNTSQ